MDKILAGDPETRSADILAKNLDQLKALFPDAFSEGKVNFEVLRQLLGDTVDDRVEKYGLTWHGKRRARQLALTPSAGTLRPCPEDSVDWDTTQNLMIEGDNLEVLNLLQKSYAGKVKLIYIDPPYNTGKDFVYPDDFRDTVSNYLALTNQLDARRKVSSNTETSGRYHTDWMNMIYPRLKLARNLLTSDGILAVSIDDIEISSLRKILDEIFGEENFLCQLIWKSRVSEDTRARNGVSNDHEYIICYSRFEGSSFRGADKDVSKFANPDSDPRGPWRSADLTGLATKDARPNLHYDLIDPSTSINYGCPLKGWRFEISTMEQKIFEGRIIFPTDGKGRPRHKLVLEEMSSPYKNLSSLLLEFSTAEGTRELNALMGDAVFQFPKPVALIKLLIEQVTGNHDIVLDFFAGSGSTGHSVWTTNRSEKADRRFILVQLPEPLESTDRNQKTAADFCDGFGKPGNIAELTKERLRRAATKIRDDYPDNAGDLGFRVFKLDTSNIRAWDPRPDDLEGALLSGLDHIVPGRTEQDILCELLLKLGLDLCVPIETKTIADKFVHSVGAGTLIVCLNDAIFRDDVEPLALGIAGWHDALSPAGESTDVFLDSAFADDVAKANLAETLKQHGLGNVRSL